MKKKETLEREINWLLEEKYPQFYSGFIASQKGELSLVVKKDIKRLEKGEPVAYIIGYSRFSGCKIDLTCRPLIPRPETEFWAERVVAAMKKQRQKGLIRCLDIFAGSGCIGIAVLRHLPNAKVDFSDKEEKYLKQIKINLKINNLSRKRWRLIKSDVFRNVKGKYDYILANPPYLAKKRVRSVQNTVLKYEPKGALFGGKNGLFYIRRFLKDARCRLKKGGRIYLEFDSPQKKEIALLLKKLGYSKWQFYKDQYNEWRYLIIG